ncbi:uncharacterized protein RCC_02019 [Ramularia collo-cygni]|uniref:DNA-directed RNA polymerase subunit n=1 Tax=Ramularia collo-cygni TaxID=112498 RepID=A0A2D3UVN0_9PEZI|nr:uncharacterized protein RCC_02019 [Ramularia collo-cygni]CZT16177.1 uncharacterized protein RCC_02019 [Ramularia collo-cygni]
MAKSSSKTDAASSKKKSSKSQKSPPSSPFHTLTTSLYVSLSPCSNNFPIEGLCAEHISPHLLTYYAPFNGVLLAFSNPRISETPDEAPSSDTVLAKSINEYAVTYVWLTADFLVFRPEKGTVLEGAVNVVNEGMVGLICYNYFNVAVPREQLPKGLMWDGEGWLAGEERVEVGRKVKAKVLDFEASGTEGLSISATLAEPW